MICRRNGLIKLVHCNVAVYIDVLAGSAMIVSIVNGLLHGLTVALRIDLTGGSRKKLLYILLIR